MTRSKSLTLAGALFLSLLGVQLCAASAGLAQQPPTTAAASPAVTYPDTPAGRQMAAYQQAIAAGETALAEYLTANYARGNVPALMNELAIARERSGGFVPLSVHPASTPTHIALRVRSNNSGDEFLSILVVEPSAPHRITTLGMASGGYDIGAAFKRIP